jgi:hypothetical protein
MKTNIKQLLDSYVNDNEEYIEENGGNAAEYIIADTEAEDQGWLWFLTDEEIERFEHDKEYRFATIDEIKKFVNENYDYQVEAQFKEIEFVEDITINETLYGIYKVLNDSATRVAGDDFLILISDDQYASCFDEEEQVMELPYGKFIYHN